MPLDDPNRIKVWKVNYSKLYALLACIVIALPTISTAHFAVPCFDDEVGEIDDDIDALKDGLSAIITRLEDGDLQAQVATLEWLGLKNSAEIDSVVETLRLSFVALDVTSFLCVPYDYEDHDDAGNLIVAQAFVFGGEPVIYLTADYFEADADGRDGRPSILFHEVMHLNLTAGANYFPDSEEVYEYEEAKALAVDDPEEAQNNAQNYTFFYEEAIFGPRP